MNFVLLRLTVKCKYDSREPKTACSHMMPLLLHVFNAVRTVKVVHASTGLTSIKIFMSYSAPFPAGTAWFIGSLELV